MHVLFWHDARGRSWEEVLVEAVGYAREHELRVCSLPTPGISGLVFVVTRENASGSVNEALEPLLMAAAGGMAALVGAVTSKSLGEHGEAVRGSNALIGGVDIVVELERVRASREGGRERTTFVWDESV